VERSFDSPFPDFDQNFVKQLRNKKIYNILTEANPPHTKTEAVFGENSFSAF
jgi:hypothetical protein